MSTLDRRGFLAGCLTTVGFSTAAAFAPTETVIDTHQHLWDLKKFRLNWIAKGSFLDRNFLPDDYAKAIEGLGITKAVYLEVDVDPTQQLAEAEALIELCKRGATPTRAAVISGRPQAEEFGPYIRRFKGNPYIKGVRRVLHAAETKPGHCLDRAFIRGIRLLGELDFHFELCLRPDEIVDAIQLVDACPDTRFVLDHCGNPNLKKLDRWKKDIAELAKRKHVVGKVSGIVAAAEPGKWSAADLAPAVNHTLEVFGPNRVMFGSDWPVCLRTATIAQWLGALREIVAERKAEEKRKLFHDNAVAFYRLT